LPSDNPLFRLADVLENIERIRTYTESYTFDRFISDPNARMLSNVVYCASPRPHGSFKALRRFWLRINHGQMFALWEVCFVMTTTPSIPMSYGTSSSTILDHYGKPSRGRSASFGKKT